MTKMDYMVYSVYRGFLLYEWSLKIKDDQLHFTSIDRPSWTQCLFPQVSEELAWYKKYVVAHGA